MEIWDAYYEDETLAGVDFIQYQLNRKNFS